MSSLGYRCSYTCSSGSLSELSPVPDSIAWKFAVALVWMEITINPQVYMRSYTLKEPRSPHLGKITNHFGFFSHVGRPSVRVLPLDYIWTIEFAKIPVGCHCSEFMIGALQSGKHKAGSVTCTWNWNLFVQLRLISVQSIISSQDRKTLISHTIFSSHLVSFTWLNGELSHPSKSCWTGWKMFCHTLLQAAFIVYNHIIKTYNHIFGGNFFNLQWIYGNLFATGSQGSIEIAGESVHQTFFFMGQLDVDLPLRMKGGDLLYNSFHVVPEILNAVAVQLLNIKCKRRTLLHEQSLYLCTLPCCLMTSTSCLFQGQPLTALPA